MMSACPTAVGAKNQPSAKFRFVVLPPRALDAVSFLVERLVVGVLSLAVALGRDDGVAALVDDEVEEAIGVVGFVGQDILRGQPFDQVAGGGHVVLLAWPGDEPHRQAKRVYADVELGSEAAA